MTEEVESSSIKSKKKSKMRTSDSELEASDDISGELKPKKKVKFRIEVDDDLQQKSKKRKVLGSTESENMPAEARKKPKKHNYADNQRHEHSLLDEDGNEHVDEPHSNDTIDWPQEDLRTLVNTMERTLPEKDNLAFQTRADKLNWDEIAFNKYTGDDCKKTWFLIQKRIRRFRLLSELLQDAKEWISKPWTHFYKGTKNNRHPDMPKRPLSGYMLFYLKKREKIISQHPGLEMTEISKRMAQMYKNISSEKREKYMQLAAAEKKSYEEKLEEFYRLHPDIPRCPEKSTHGKSIESGPKKPTTPFIYYFNNQLRNIDTDYEVDRTALKDQCREEWKNMSEKKKVIWIDWALEEEDKYQEELKNYMIQNPSYVHNFKSGVSKEERALKERLAGKPIKPPNSAYSLFSQMMLKSEEIKKVDPKSRMKALADQWKMFSDSEKRVYQENAEQLMIQYKLDFATYLESLPESKRQEELQNHLPKRKGKKTDEPKNKVEEEKKHDDHKRNIKIDDKNMENNSEEIMNADKAKDEAEKIRESVEKEKVMAKEKQKAIDKEKEKQKLLEKDKDKEKYKMEQPESDEENDDMEDSSKKRKRKPERSPRDNSKEEANKQISLTKIFEAQPPHPPESGFALFSKRYHGKIPVKTAWKNLNKLEKREYEAEVQMLKQKYIKDYEMFLKSLSKEQLTAFSQFNKGRNKPNKQEEQIQEEIPSEEDDEEEEDDDEDYNTDNTDI